MKQCYGTVTVCSKDFGLLTADPNHLRHSAYPASTEEVISMSVTTSRFKGPLANLFTSGKVAWGESASGGSAHSCYSCLSPLCEIQSCCTLFTALSKLQLLLCLSSEKYLRKTGLNSIYVNQNRQCVVMMGVHVWVIRCQHWMVAVKWAFSVVCLWAIKCQLFVPLLSRGDLNRCTTEDELFQTGGKFCKGFSNIIHMGQWSCRMAVLTFHYW